jgi:RNA polymerase sigma factor for flagellar operon FliA
MQKQANNTATRLRGPDLRYHEITASNRSATAAPTGEFSMYTAKGQLDRNALIRQYQPLVRKLAHHMMAKLPASVQVDDLIQVGLIGLSEALTRYEATQGVQFETFATQRIRGAMIDELRVNDWMSRGSRKSQKDIEQALRRLEHQLGRSPLESEIAQELGMSLADYQSLLGKVRGTQLVYLEDMSRGGDSDEGFLEHHDVADDSGDPMAALRDQRLRESLMTAIKNLPEREQFVMSMYYEQDMNLKEIAAVLGVTESRVCQLHSQSIARLRAKMRAH